MKIKVESIEELFIENIFPVMERHGYYFLEHENSFVHENKEWKNECNLHFTNWGDDRVSLRTEYFVTSKKIGNLLDNITSITGNMPICGVLDVGWAYKYFEIPIENRPWFEMKIAKLDSIAQKWIVEFESVGLSFFQEMNDYEKLEKLLDIFNVSPTPSSSSVWMGERVLHGICLHYIRTGDKRATLELFSLYRKKIERIKFHMIKNQYIRLEKYFRDLPDDLEI